MVKAYFFDWMGTLADLDNRKTTREVLGRELHNLLLIKKLEDIDISNEKRESIYSMLSSGNHLLYSDSIEVISKLKSQNYKLAIVSNMYDITLQEIRKSFSDFLSQFDVLTFSAEVGLKKPDEKIFINTLDKLNSLPEEAIMVGDREDRDYYPAIKLGMRARLIDRTKQNLRDII